jgi:hypothetical protein
MAKELNQMPELITVKVPRSPHWLSEGGYDLQLGENNGVCCVCNRRVDIRRAWGVHMIEGGYSLLHPDSEPDYVSDGGDMCLQFVGTDCYRRFPELKGYGRKPGKGDAA